jgi:hypothetical protein
MVPIQAIFFLYLRLHHRREAIGMMARLTYQGVSAAIEYFQPDLPYNQPHHPNRVFSM